jgi:hypothetical protein
VWGCAWERGRGGQKRAVSSSRGDEAAGRRGATEKSGLEERNGNRMQREHAKLHSAPSDERRGLPGVGRMEMGTVFDLGGLRGGGGRGGGGQVMKKRG